MPARLLYSQRDALGPAEFTEARIWMVEPSPRFPGGVKYSFTYVRSDGLRLRRHYGIDNAHGGPPHEHVGPETHELADMTLDAVRERFRAQVTALRGRGA